MTAIPLVVLALCFVTGPVAARVPQGAQSPVYEPGNGVSAPVVVKDVKPQYTADAMRAKVEGTVVLACVVKTDGSIGDVKVARSLDAGLDQEAIKAIKQWRFKPGLKDGKAVAVRVSIEMTFTLK
jgi:TonB family protein